MILSQFDTPYETLQECDYCQVIGIQSMQECPLCKDNVCYDCFYDHLLKHSWIDVRNFFQEEGYINEKIR